VTLIQVQDVTVVIAARQEGRSVEIRALDGVSLTVRSGEVMGVIGPTGCGKTTLLRAVAGLIPIQKGRVLYDGKDQAAVPTQSRGIGMVFQDYALYSHWNVWDNLAFYFKLRRHVEKVPDKVQEAAEILGVNFDLLLGRMPRNLSMGQRQQVAIGRCLVRDPKIFLMDEPFANLDAVQRQHARLQLKRLLLRFPVTTLYVTHDQLEASALCDRLAVMGAGRVHQVDTYNNLLHWPKTRQVADFVTEPGTQLVEGAQLEEHFACPQFSLPLQPHVLVRTHPGQALSLRVRPISVSLVAAETKGDGVLSAAVEWIEPVPTLRLKRVMCQIDEIRLPLEIPIDQGLQVGEQVRLRLDAERVDVFDGSTGVNLAFRAAP
jgi:ABC-type sugar transport system ATPase subunit